MKRAVLLGLAATTLLSSPGAWAQKSPEQELEEAEAEFRQQHYRRTTDLLNPLLYPAPRLANVDDQQQAREMLGASFWQLGELPHAEREFERLLQSRPSFQLDEFYYPKPMRDFVEKLRDTLIKQGLIKPAQYPEPIASPPQTLMRINTVLKPNRATAFMPFGVGQFENGNDGLGWFFATSQGASLASMMSLSLAYTFAFKSGQNVRHDQKDAADGVYLSLLVSGAVFGALWAWSAIDANVRLGPERIVRSEVITVPSETADTRPPQPKPAPLPGGSH